jgi:hypothetical protein
MKLGKIFFRHGAVSNCRAGSALVNTNWRKWEAATAERISGGRLGPIGTPEPFTSLAAHSAAP